MVATNEPVVKKEEQPANLQRLQLDLSQEAYQWLQEIKGKAHVQTNTEVIRKALSLYEWFLDQQRSEFNQLQVTNGEIVKEIEIIL